VIKIDDKYIKSISIDINQTYVKRSIRLSAGRCPIHDVRLVKFSGVFSCTCDDCSVKAVLRSSGFYELDDGPDELIDCFLLEDKKITIPLPTNVHDGDTVYLGPFSENDLPIFVSPGYGSLLNGCLNEILEIDISVVSLILIAHLHKEATEKRVYDWKIVSWGNR